MLDTYTHPYYRGGMIFAFEGEVYRYNRGKHRIERILGYRGRFEMIDPAPVSQAVIDYEAQIHAEKRDLDLRDNPLDRISEFYPVELTAYDAEGNCVAFRFREDPGKITLDEMIEKLHAELKGSFDAVRIVMDTALSHVQRPSF